MTGSVLKLFVRYNLVYMTRPVRIEFEGALYHVTRVGVVGGGVLGDQRMKLPLLNLYSGHFFPELLREGAFGCCIPMQGSRMKENRYKS